MDYEPLSEEEIKTFITTFKSYIERASESELNYLSRESNRKYRQMYYTNQAKKHNVSLDYYISEFTKELSRHASTELDTTTPQDGQLFIKMRSNYPKMKHESG